MYGVSVVSGDATYTADDQEDITSCPDFFDDQVMLENKPACE